MTRLDTRIPRRLVPVAAAGFAAALTGRSRGATAEGAALRDALMQAAAKAPQASWRPMLEYAAELHGRSVQPARAHFPYPFESIGPGYEGGNAFGHIDLTHIRLDTVQALPENVRNQTRNELAGQ